jgi:hypothetical protein
MVSARAVRSMNRALRAVQWLLVLALVVVLWRVVGWERPSSAAAERRASGSTETVEPQSDPVDGLPPLSEYSPIWQRDLRQSPLPPEARTAKDTAPPKPPVPLPRLLGTFSEQADAWAHLVGHKGRSRILRTGDRITGYTLVTIEPGRVQLQNGSREYWVEVPKRDPVITERE